MADEQTPAPADKPLEHLKLVENDIKPPEPADPETPAEPETAEQKLREFEDRVMGNPPRIDGKVERGIGSKFSNMPPQDKATHAALERLVAAESAHVAAVRKLGEAENDLAEAQIRLDAAGKASEPADAGNK